MKILVFFMLFSCFFGNTPVNGDKIEEEIKELEIRVENLKNQRAADILGIMRKNNLCLGGLKSRYIKDRQLSSSGYFKNLESHSHVHGRLDSNTGVGGWAAAEADKNMYQWIQVDLYKPKRIFGVMVQGRSQIQQWVTKFKVQYGNSPDHLNYINYSRSNPKAMIFDGVTDPHTAYARRFPQPIVTRFIRIVVADFSVHPCLRFDVLEC